MSTINKHVASAASSVIEGVSSWKNCSTNWHTRDYKGHRQSLCINYIQWTLDHKYLKAPGLNLSEPFMCDSTTLHNHRCCFIYVVEYVLVTYTAASTDSYLQSVGLRLAVVLQIERFVSGLGISLCVCVCVCLSLVGWEGGGRGEEIV